MVAVSRCFDCSGLLWITCIRDSDLRLTISRGRRSSGLAMIVSVFGFRGLDFFGFRVLGFRALGSEVLGLLWVALDHAESGFGVWGLGFGVWTWGFGVRGLGLRVPFFRFRISGLGF